MPFNKALWTTPYALLMAELASLVSAVWFWLADIRGLARWFRPYEIFGTNASLMFLVSNAFAKFMARAKVPYGETTISLHGWFYREICQALA